MCSVKVLVFSVLLAAIAVLSESNGIYNEDLFDKLRQFPHHVFIVVSGSGQKCAGTILNRHWVLTSAFCVRDGIELELYFRKKQKMNSSYPDFMTVSVNKKQVFVYPTNYDDIALIKIPIRLEYSDSLAPMNVSKLQLDALRDRYTVMPTLSNFILDNNSTTISTEKSTPTTTAKSSARRRITLAPTTISDELDERSQNLKYGMYSVLDNKICKEVYGTAFDEYTQLCVDAWGNNPFRPCDSDFGSGLIVGWPARGELVGVFHMPSKECENRRPSVFTFTGKYLPWIDSMISGYN